MASILVAEDNAVERGLIVRGLAGDGHVVSEAENGAAALQRFLTDPAGVAVLVTDVEMPELDGIELARRALAAKPGLKVLLLSGFAGGLERAADLKALGVRSLVKPVALETVRAEVKALLG